MKINKKLIAIGVVAIAVVAGGAFWFLKGNSGGTDGDSENTVNVDSVAVICGLSGNGLNDRFSGIVEPQQTLKIEIPSDKKVGEVYVKQGDEIKAGDKLFSYDIEDIKENLEQEQINFERGESEIELKKKEIESLEKEKAAASADSQLGYTTQINSQKNTLKRKEYDQKSLQVTINKLKESMTNIDVTSEISGVVKTLNNTSKNSDENYSGDEAEPFMTILETGDYRIKGIVNEQNMQSIVEGLPVLVRSRVDDTIWKGSLTSVDMDNPEKSENEGYYGYSDSSSSMNNSSNYPFYVELESVEGLMLGQHVYIEMDYGQEEQKDGIWLDSYYIIQEEDKAYVWAATAKDKIEKRSVTLGEFDESLQKYQIVSGLTADDYIAYPDDEIAEGNVASKNTNQAGGNAMDIGDTDMGIGMEKDVNFGEEEIDGEYMEEDTDAGMEDES